MADILGIISDKSSGIEVYMRKTGMENIRNSER